MAGKVIDRDRGAKALFKRFGNGRVELKVGLIGDKARAKHPNADMTVAELGTIHEFGLGHVPQRSFVRQPLDDNLDRLKAAERRALRRVIRTDPLRKAAETVGKEAVRIMQGAIDDGIPPPLAPETAARKGSSQTLIDTTTLYNALDFKVEKAG